MIDGAAGNAAPSIGGWLSNAARLGAMRVLVTGHRGMIGRVVVHALDGGGHVVVGFDRQDGQDVLDRDAVEGAVEGCDAVVHLAALQDPRPGEHDAPAHTAVPGLDAARAVVEVNAMGSQHVMKACLLLGVPRLVVTSSVNALGVFKGQARPDFLPIDDQHRARPRSPYGLSKRATERVAEAVSAEGGLTTICLRPPAVLDDAMIDALRERRRQDPASEWHPIWEYGAWIHVEDLARAIVAAIGCPVPPGGHATVLVCADDVASDRFGAREMVRRWAPGVPWRGDDERYRTDRWRSLVDASPAKALLAWSPQRRWPRSESTPREGARG